MKNFIIRLALHLIGILIATSISFAEPTRSARMAIARDLFRQGFDSYKNKNYTDSIRLFKEGLIIDPSDATAWIYYGHGLLALSQRISARNAYRKAESLLPASNVKAALRARIESIKPSIAPGDNCRDQVERLDPTFVANLVSKLQDIPVIKNITLRYINPTTNTNWDVTRETCGDFYLLEIANFPDGTTRKNVYLIGYPHIGPIYAYNQEKSMYGRLTATDAYPIEYKPTKTSWNTELQYGNQTTYSTCNVTPATNISQNSISSKEPKYFSNCSVETYYPGVGRLEENPTSMAIYPEMQLGILTNDETRKITSIDNAD
ncbi:tetratricopeptide repeat protein [Methylibium sp.]|uniref:tetratricopeptide repeat protein n=1 Tax=Methylibium sp. TaxID=2067992 RepID=UPI003D097D2D